MLIRDRDTKFTRGFDDVFTADGTNIIVTPVAAPNANAVAERWISSARRECLDWLLIGGERHLQRVPVEYVDHYNSTRPHRASDLHPPRSSGSVPTKPFPSYYVRRRDRLGGLLHEYEPLVE